MLHLFHNQPEHAVVPGDDLDLASVQPHDLPAMKLAESQWVTEIAEHKMGGHFGQLCLGQDRTGLSVANQVVRFGSGVHPSTETNK